MNSTLLPNLGLKLPSLEAIKAEKARRSIERQAKIEGRSVEKQCATLAGFVRQAWPVLFPDTPYVHGWHIDFICQHLESITRGVFLEKGYDNRLLANVPPSTMKSLLVSVFWPAWEWGSCGLAHLQYITTSFREDFCLRDARRMRTLVMSTWYQQHWGDRVKLVNTGEGHIENSAGGWRQAVAFGSLTGGKCDRLILDDPHSVDGAESDKDRDRAVLRFRESATTRLNDPRRSAIVVIMQRLHEKDIAGTIISLKLKYVHIMLPMRFEIDRRCVTPLGEDPRTIAGELLFPERFPRDIVDRDERTMGAYATASQHQQRPAPRGGLLFKTHWFKFVKAVPGNCRRIRGWDLAASETEGAAFTCGVRIAYDPALRHFYIENVVRERVSNPEPLMKRIAATDGNQCEISLPQDPGAAGKIQARSIIASLVGYNAYASPETGDKETRARPVAAQAEAGNVSIVEADWNEAFMDELAKFPAGAFKDQVDALSRAFSRFVMQTPAPIYMPQILRAPKQYHGDYVNG